MNTVEDPYACAIRTRRAEINRKQETKKFRSDYTGVSAERTFSRIRIPAWTSSAVSYYIRYPLLCEDETVLTLLARVVLVLLARRVHTMNDGCEEDRTSMTFVSAPVSGSPRVLISWHLPYY